MIKKNKKFITVIMSGSMLAQIVGAVSESNGDPKSSAIIQVATGAGAAGACDDPLKNPDYNPVDDFQASMKRFQTLIGKNPQFEAEALRIAQLLDIEDTNTLLGLAGLYGLQIEVPLKQRKNRSERVTKAATEGVKNPDSGLVLTAANNFLSSIPINGGEAVAKVIGGLEEIEKKRQASIEGEQKKGWKQWVKKQTIGRLRSAKSKLAEALSQGDVVASMNKFSELVDEETEALTKEKGQYEDVVDELHVNFVVISINLAAALRVRQHWLSTLVPKYKNQFAASEIDESMLDTVNENYRMLERIIWNLIAMEGKTIQMIDQARQSVRHAASLIVDELTIKTQTIPFLTQLLQSMFAGKLLTMRVTLTEQVRELTNALSLEGDKANAEASLRIAAAIEKGILDPATIQSGFKTLTDTAKKRLKIIDDAAKKRLADGTATRLALQGFVEEITQVHRAELTAGMGQQSAPAIEAPKTNAALPEPRQVEIVTPLNTAERLPVETRPIEAEIVTPPMEKPLENGDGTSGTGTK